ncbi:YadA-like family protein [uncultured Sneathia sp.]|uniref:YadA family autotransporter adhesin n=1 Tax=uncultured Sneathia sp. TaxID=278067 RepID=UPI00259BC364|nr:YadA-like family protein [uncultured Sneathia sp.]
MNINDIKFSFKFKLKLMILTILPFLFYGSIGYADNIKIYVDAQSKKVLTEEEYSKLTNEEKNKYKLVVIDENNKAYTINLNDGLHYISVNSNEKGTGSNYANDGAKEDKGIVIGVNSSSEGAYGIVLGNNDKLVGIKNGKNNSVVIGNNLDVDGTYNVVVGIDYYNGDNKLTKVSGEHNVVIGAGNLVGWTAINKNADKKDQLAEWEYNKKGSDQNVVTGMTNTISGGSVIFGKSSKVEDLGMSFGYGNEVIGSNSKYKEKDKEQRGGQHGLALGSFLVSAGEDAISIGRDSNAIGNYTIASGSNSNAIGLASMAYGYKANVNGNWSLAIGPYSNANVGFATALGVLSKVNYETGVALGYGSISNRDKGNIGYVPFVSNVDLNKKIGNDKKYDEWVSAYKKWKEKNDELNKKPDDKNLKEEVEKLSAANILAYNKAICMWKSTGATVSIGNEDTGMTRQLTGLAAGSEDTDAVNVAQLKQVIKNQYINVKAGEKTINVKLGDTLVLKGNGIGISVEDGDKTSKQPETTTNTTTSQPESSTPAEPKVQEHTATFEVKGNVGGSNTFEYVLGEKVLSEEDYSKLKSDEKNNVILRVKDGEKVITNVANGVKDKDAVNVSQLKAVRTKVEKNTSDIQQLQKDVKEVDKKSDLALGGVSNAVAMANLPQVMGDKKFNLAASYGYYGGSHAVAVGFSGTNDNQNFIYKLSGSVNSKGNLAFGIGAGVMLGSVNSKDKRISDLETRLKEQTEKTNRLEKQLEKVMKRLGQN